MSTARKVVLLDGDPIGLFGGGGGAKPEEIGIKYDEENDVIQLYYDGQWRDWKTGGMAYPVGTEILFSYLNIPQQFVVPATGIWKVELWGGKGGDSRKYYNGGSRVVNGGAGAYIKGNARFESDDVLYIVTGDGGKGISQSANTGYNGGGNRLNSGGQGAGATHIAKNTGDLLKVTPINDIIMVAGGGGGAGCGSNWDAADAPGGAGGYPNGSSGTALNWGTSGVVAQGGSGGTQTAGGSGANSGSFGQGGNAAGNDAGSGGGGYYGGGSGGSYSRGGTQGAGGGGGSSFAASSVTDLQYSTHSDIQGHAKLTYLGRGIT